MPVRLDDGLSISGGEILASEQIAELSQILNILILQVEDWLETQGGNALHNRLDLRGRAKMWCTWSELSLIILHQGH